MAIKQPSLPIPAPLRGADKGTFAESTISERLPGIARRVAAETDWPADIHEALIALADDMPHGRLRSLGDGGLDVPAWDLYLSSYEGQKWLEPPWFVVEMYFFRRILEASGYFQPGPGAGVDPYQSQKQRGLEVVTPAVAPLSARVGALIEAVHQRRPVSQDALAGLLRAVIWGNQADLSMWPAGETDQPAAPVNDEEQDQGLNPLLCDEAGEAAAYLLGAGAEAGQIDFILDNSGIELAYDLALTDFLLGSSLAARVIFHVKPYPTYVSDATAADVRATILHFENADDQAVRQMGQRLRGHLGAGALRLATHYYWVSPLIGWQMPTDLRNQLGISQLLISKGDANYRRWLGDRHWPYTAPLKEILNYLPAPWLALRILKANMTAGMPQGIPEAAAAQDPDWLYSGGWGLIQFVNPR